MGLKPTELYIQFSWHGKKPAADHSSELLHSLDSSGNAGTAAQQNDSLSLSRRQLPSEFHFSSVMKNWESGTLMQ